MWRLAAINLPGRRLWPVDNNNNLWVADTGHHVICLVSNNTVTVIAGISGSPGTNDSPIATTARFNLPAGLLWSSVDNSLIISDTGNDTIRSLFVTNFNGGTTYSVQTIAGIPGNAGSADGALGIPLNSVRQPGLAVDVSDFGFYIAQDRGNNAVRVIQPSAPQPPVSAPQLLATSRLWQTVTAA